MISFRTNENTLYEIFPFDNGPDYLKEGRFRIVRNGKIGYANKFGEIVIPCQFDFAYPFSNGYAKVSKNCRPVKKHDHYIWESKSLFGNLFN
ncbi:MAG: WG repeat-containing protein [Bacteroidota bacterium]